MSTEANRGPATSVSAAQVALLTDGWAGTGNGSLARRLAHVLRARIASGLLAAGTVLPPERSLAVALGVSRSTVVAAFDELRAAGLLCSRQGSGTWVATTEPAGAPAASAAERLLLGGANVNLAASVPADASHLPDLGVDAADLASVAPAHGYAPAGLPVLREAIARRHCMLGLPTSAEQVHVTNGAQHAIDLALGAVTRRGDIVAVEDPTYVGVFDVFDRRRLRASPLPLDAVERDPRSFARLCRASRARAVFLVPAVHSPTGRVRRAPALRALAEQLDDLGLPVIEDNTVADLAFSGTRPPSLATLCRRAPVVSIESTSKVAWGGLHLGWLRADTATVERTVVERGQTDFGTSVPSQLIALRLLDDYEALVAARRVSLAQAAKLFVQLLRAQLPEWRFVPPRGGLSLWVDTGCDADELGRNALRHGVTIAPGTSATRSAAGRTHLRLCFDRPPLEIEAGLSRLRRAFEDTRGWRR